MRKQFLCLLAMLLFVFSTPLYASQVAEEIMSLPVENAEESDPHTGNILLQAWQINRAAKIVDKILQTGDTSEEAQFFLGNYFFHTGDYTRALEHLNGAGDYRPKGVLNYQPYLEAAYNNTKDMVSKKSEHFEVKYQDDKESIIADAVLDTMERTYLAIGNELGLQPVDRIVVEIYPKLEMLAAATGLTLKELKTSGTIAICKFNRIMISSPRVSPYGYTWRDTLCHEYIHLIICRISANTVPIWLHEGIAKSYEERWRSSHSTKMTSTGESLLSRALREDKLITIKEMHPSMALLPSQEHAALAYTEVLTMVEWLNQRRGSQKLQRLLRTIPKVGGDLDKAFKQVYSFDTVQFQELWESSMKNRRLREYPNAFDDYSILFDTRKQEDTESAIEKLEEKKGKKYMTLGKLLKDRNHPKAASMEFEKAQQSLGKENVQLQNFIAQTFLELEKYEKAARALEPLIRFSPNWMPTRVRLAEAYLGLGVWEVAVEHLVYAFGINPFNPQIHKMLKIAYERLNKQDMAKLAEANFKLLVN